MEERERRREEEVRRSRCEARNQELCAKSPKQQQQHQMQPR